MRTDRFDVRYSPQAKKDMKRLRPWTEHAFNAVFQLEADPYKGHTLLGSLRGTRSLEFSLKGSGVFRALYVVIEDEQACLVFIVGPHENIYERAERRIAALRRSGEL